jgi:hypothetical protein
MSTINYFKHQYLEDFNGVFHDVISISNEVLTLNISLEQFLFFVPDYKLPEGCKERDYVQGLYNRLILEDDSIQEDVVPFPEGDIYIENAQNYIPIES